MSNDTFLDSTMIERAVYFCTLAKANQVNYTFIYDVDKLSQILRIPPDKIDSAFKNLKKLGVIDNYNIKGFTNGHKIAIPTWHSLCM